MQIYETIPHKPLQVYGLNKSWGEKGIPGIKILLFIYSNYIPFINTNSKQLFSFFFLFETFQRFQ